jgi:hypothetical protein
VIQAVSSVERIVDGDVDAFDVCCVFIVHQVWTQNNLSDECKAGSSRFAKAYLLTLIEVTYASTFSKTRVAITTTMFNISMVQTSSRNVRHVL